MHHFAIGMIRFELGHYRLLHLRKQEVLQARKALRRNEPIGRLLRGDAPAGEVEKLQLVEQSHHNFQKGAVQLAATKNQPTHGRIPANASIFERDIREFHLLLLFLCEMFECARCQLLWLSRI